MSTQKARRWNFARVGAATLVLTVAVWVGAESVAKANGCPDGDPCDDLNPCTQSDTCQNGICQGQPLPDGTPCDDEDPCSVNDYCQSFDGGIRCAPGEPNPACGCCEIGVPASTGGALDVVTSTVMGSCVAPIDEQTCTNDYLGQFFQGAPCNEEIGLCETSQATCGNGTVESGEQCDDGNTFDGDCCSATCQFEAVNTPCDDGDPCTVGDMCVEGQCASGQPVNCDDANVCTTDSCNPSTGQCQSNPNPGEACDDNDLCTTNDTCNEEGLCAGTTISCQPPNPPCDLGEICDPETGNCVEVPDPGAGVPCDRDQNACTLDYCDGDGNCVFASNAANGASCDDRLFCNGTDTCDGLGVCVHSGNPCSSGGECNQTCNEAGDNCFDPAGTPCSDDGQVCTQDVCDGAGSCSHSDVPAQQCPKGYVLLQAPSSAGVLVDVAYTAQANDGGACANKVRLRQASLVDGDAVGASGVTLGQDAIANGTCVTAGSPVSLGVNAQCVGGTDNSGTHPLLGDCQGAADQADTRRGVLQGLAANLSLGAVTVSSNTTWDLTPFSTTPGSVVVVDCTQLTLNPNRTLTLKGNANTEAVIVRVSGNFRARYGSVLTTQGISPGPNSSPAERVLLLVGGTGEVRISAQVQGTIYTQGTLIVRRNAVVDGALVSATSPLRVRPSAIVNHAPWVLW